jgi:hypothetical protein
MSDKYKHLEILDAKGAPAPEDVAAIEALLGRPLPPDFLDFLSVANGALLEYCVPLRNFHPRDRDGAST